MSQQGPFTTDTIAAIATARGQGGIGIVRVSGPAAPAIARHWLGRTPRPRHAHHLVYRDDAGEPLDEGLLLYFPAPASFTGEDVLELHGHGSDAGMAVLLAATLALGARPARPGEFSERAYLNGKIDLTRAEAIADLINAQTAAAARAAAKSLTGAFADKLTALRDGLVALRVRVEAGLDFADEDIAHEEQSRCLVRADDLAGVLRELLAGAERGRRLNDGLDLVLAGRPNAGKSTLLNALAGHEAAIVTDIPGTTRDLLRERIEIDGLPINLIDTAGLRPAATDPIEIEGMRRARAVMAGADHVLLLVDAEATEGPDPELPEGVPVTRILTKTDRTGIPAGWQQSPPALRLSARTGAGMDLLRAHLLSLAGFDGGQAGGFSARQRHLDALARAALAVDATRSHLADDAPELAAEALREAQRALDEITGVFHTEDLLGAIFSAFCIGK